MTIKLFKTLLLALILALALSLAVSCDEDEDEDDDDIFQVTGPALCGDSLCDAGEDAASCPEDCAAPGWPALAGFLPSELIVGSVTVDGTVAYVTAYDLLALQGSLLIIDVSDPAAPILLSAYPAADAIESVAISGDLAFLATQSSGLEIVDVSDPAAPAQVSFFDYGGNYAMDLEIMSGYAFVADALQGLVVVDLANLASPAIVGQVDEILCFPNSLTLAADGQVLAYMTGPGCGLNIVDVTDPLNPAIIGEINNLDGEDVSVDGGLAFVSQGLSGFAIVDAADPTAPVALSSVDTSGSTHAAEAQGNLLYVADGPTGLVIMDISDPAAPMIETIYDTATSVADVSIDGDMAYLVRGGLMILDLSL